MNKVRKQISRCLTVIILALMVICVVLFFQIVTKQDVSLGGIRFYYILTESMSPTIQPYSIVVTRKTDPEKLKEGDVISFISRDPEIYGMTNTHRIYEVTQDEEGNLAYITMGDHNPAPDAYLVYPGEIKGKMMFHTFPLRGLTQVLSFVATKTGFFVVILLPLCIVAAMFMGSFMKEFSRSLEAEKRALEDLQRKREAEKQLQTKRFDAEQLSPEQAAAILEMIFQKKVTEITVQDLEEKLAHTGKGSSTADGMEKKQTDRTE